MKVIKSYNELAELHQRLSGFDIYHLGEKYRIRLPHLDHDENIRVTRTINNYTRRSSCNGG